MFMPVGFGSLPFDISFFFYGAIAAKNNWLGTEGGLPAVMDRHRWWLRSLWLLLTVAVFLFYALNYEDGKMLYFNVGDDDGDQTKSAAYTKANEENSFEMTSVMFQFGVSGFYVSIMSLVLLDFFRHHFDFTGPITNTLARCSYTSYIIHPFTVCFGMYVFQETYKRVTGNEVNYEHGGLFSTTNLENHDAWMWGGAAVVSVWSVASTYCLAYLITMVPGANKIL